MACLKDPELVNLKFVFVINTVSNVCAIIAFRTLRRLRLIKANIRRTFLAGFKCFHYIILCSYFILLLSVAIFTRLTHSDICIQIFLCDDY